MAYENLCMYCFEELGGHSACPHCGRDAHAAVPQIQMLPGTLVYHDRFLIGRALGQDSTGIVYAAFDTKKENKLRIREYLPRDCAERLNDGSVVPIAGMEDKYDAGIRKLRASVEDVEEPRKRHFFFEENGTAYIVQRKAAGEGASGEHERRHEEPEEHSKGRAAIIAIVAAIAVVAAAIALVMIFNGSLNNAKDVTETPTLDPDNIWVPAETPTVTPYVSPTFAALVDPDLSWMDYTFTTDAPSAGNTSTNTSGNTCASATRVPTATPRPTAAPTLSGDASGYKTVSGKSAAADVRALQQKLVTLGWLDYTNINGSYDAATRQAVRDFQTYINENYRPATKLAVDGVAGPKTQQWLYQTNATKPTATPRVTATPRPTATPTPKVTVAPDDDTVVDAESSAKKIRAMQRELILLGVLPEGTDSGSYDATTRSAVRRFQTRVNQLQGYEVLEVSGRMDALSMAFLDYYVDEWRAIQTATATPTAKATATPTPTPTPKATQYESEKDPDSVNARSSKEAILDLQRSLIDVGLLPAGSDDGVYGASTVQAVTTFQNWVNARRSEETLTVTGEADPLTRSYLRYCKQNKLKPAAEATATAGPTAEPTATPEAVIQRGSDRETVRQVQELLADVGLLSRRGIDGVYGATTAEAVRKFQEYVNAHGGELDVSGTVDGSTRLALENYSANGMTVNDVEETPTPVPTIAPQEPEEDIDEEPDVTVDENAAAESISYVQMMLASIGAMSEDGINGEYDAATAQAVVDFQNWVNAQGITRLEVTGIVDNGTRQMLEYCYGRDMTMALNTPEPTAEPTEEPAEIEPEGDDYAAGVSALSIDVGGVSAADGTVEMGGQGFTVSWAADGPVDGYYVYVSDSAGNAMISAEDIDNTSFNVDADRMRPGEVYTVTVGARPAGGTQDDIVCETARFTRSADAATPEPTEAPTPEPLPTVATVSEPRIAIEGSANGDGVVEIAGGSFRIRWGADGGVQGYNVRITDDVGSVLADEAGITQTEITLQAGKMTPGTVYTITVGAIPENGSSADVVWSSSSFAVPVVATPEPTEIPTPEPTEAPTPEPTVASVGRPTVTVGGSGYQENGVQYMTDSTIIISWTAEGDVEGYVVYVENPNGGRTTPVTTTDTSRTFSADNLDPGMYTVYVGAIPRYGTQDDAQWGTTRFGKAGPTSAPTEEPTPEPEIEAGEYEDEEDYEDVVAGVNASSGDVTPIDADSDASTVAQLQVKLYKMGIMDDQEAEQGVLDEATLRAVAEFQNRANEQFDAGLRVIDPDNPRAVVDVNTLEWIARGL